jgi:GT2 family glycosyltransferase
MNVGIGITTTPNREHLLKECLSNLKRNTKVANLYVHNDKTFRGVAYSKNMCLYNLMNNSYIFLFDDDCYPIHNDWLDYVIDCFDYTGENHFLYLNESHQPLETQKHVGIRTFKECGGVFMALTKTALNTIGYMDKEYSGWGFEHAGYSNRIHKSGLTSTPYMMPDKLPEYLFAHDYSRKKIESSVTDFQKQSNYHHNFKVFQRELTEHNYFKPFKP